MPRRGTKKQKNKKQKKRNADKGSHGFTTIGEPVKIPYSGFVFITYLIRSILQLPCVMVYYVVSVLF